MVEEQAQPTDSRMEVTNTPSQASQHDSSFMKWQFENKPEIQRMKLKLKGLEYSPFTKKYEQICRPVLSDEGIFRITGLVEVYTGKIFQLTNYTQDEIDILVESFELDVVRFLSSYAKEYGLTVLTDMDYVLLIVSGPVMASVKRSLNAGTYKGMSMGFQHTEVSQMNPQRRGGWLSRLLPKTI